MKILIIHQYFLEEGEAGAPRWNEITKVWAERGDDITVLAGMIHANGDGKRPEYKGKYFVKKNHGKVNVIRCHVSESYNANFLGRLWGYFSFVFSALWAGMFKAKGKYDLILVTSPPLFIGISGYLISRLRRIPLVFEIRDLWPESAIDTGVVKNGMIIKMAFWLEAFLYRKAKLINVLTPAFRTTLLEKKNVPAEKIIFIPNASDFSFTDHLMESFDIGAFRKELGLEGRFVISYVGAHGVANHLDQVLETGKLLEDTNVTFLLIGEGMEKQKLIEKAKQMQVNNVRFLDPVPKADIFKYILASEMGASVLKKVEAFKTVYSNKTFDYMSCKRPILMVIDGVSRQLVEEANAGVYVEPENPQDFAEKIRHYIAHPELLSEQGEAGYQYAKKHFDRHNLARNYSEFLEKTIRKNV